MFEKLRIEEQMEVADSTGRHIGTVDAVVDDRMKLTRAESGDGAHHFIGINQIDRIEDGRIFLKQGTPIPIGIDI